MIQLLVTDPDADLGSPLQGHIGGAPRVPDGFQWPTCASCEGNMQFVGQLTQNQRLYLMFQCQNDPGVCDEWEADGGGNAAFAIEASEAGALKPAVVPDEGVVAAGEMFPMKEVAFDAPTYEDARSGWAEQNMVGMRQVLGMAGGEPAWLQADETPECNECNKPMRFVAQLEEGPLETDLNFGGGGIAYVFDCAHCKGSAKFLWQC